MNTTTVQSIVNSKTWQKIVQAHPKARVVQTERQAQIGSVHIDVNEQLSYSITAAGSVCRNKKHKFSVATGNIENPLVTIHHGLRWVARNLEV